MRRKLNFKNIISIGLAVLVLFGAVGAVASFATNDSRTIGFNAFEIGSLLEVDGQYVEDKTAIFTKEAFECQGFKVKPEFDSDVTYQIFWYNEDELYLDCTDKTTLKSAQFVGSTPELAKYARIVIYPSQLDEDGKQIKDFKVSIFDIPRIVNNLNITVDKEQNYDDYNLLDNLVVYQESMGTKNEVLLNNKNIMFENTSSENGLNLSLNDVVLSNMEGRNVIKLYCSDYSIYKVILPEGKSIDFYFYSSDGTVLGYQNYTSEGEILVELPSSSSEIVTIIKTSSIGEIVIRPYMTR